MATRKPKRTKQLNHFFDHEDQEAKDLLYGEQKASCKTHIKRDTAYQDHSIGGDWTPDED